MLIKKNNNNNNYIATTTTKATRQNFTQIYLIKIVEVNNSFAKKYPYTGNQAVHYKGNSFVVIMDNSLKNYS